MGILETKDQKVSKRSEVKNILDSESNRKISFGPKQPRRRRGGHTKRKHSNKQLRITRRKSKQ